MTLDYPQAQNAATYVLDAEVQPDDNVEMIADTTATTTTYDTYMEGYFRGLTKNMGRNYKGSCGYVALGQLLSYYDSYLDDYIIDDTYDVASTGTGTNMISRNNSPGVLNDTISYSEFSPYADSIDELSAKDYFSIIQKKTSTSLHAKLITMGEAKGYYDYKDDTNPCGTTYTQRKTILEQYLKEIGLSSDYYEIVTFSNSKTSKVKAFIKKYIDLGYPVLTSVRNASKNIGHAVICYDYDDTNIYCNMGWTGSNSYTHTAIESRYDTYRNAMVLIIKNLSHMHAYNYKVTTGGSTKTYCYCNCDILTYKEVGHSYTDHYVDYGDNFYHRTCCRCDKYILEEHSWVGGTIFTGIENGITLNCKQCGAVKSSGGGELM